MNNSDDEELRFSRKTVILFGLMSCVCLVFDISIALTGWGRRYISGLAGGWWYAPFIVGHWSCFS